MGLAMIVATSILSMPTPVQAAPAAPATVTRAGLTADAYQKAFDALTGAKFRLVSVSGYVENGRIRYAGLWRKTAGPAQYARHGMSAAAYDKALDERAKAGFHLVSVTPFGVGKKTVFNAIWEQRQGPAVHTKPGLTSNAYQKLFDERTKDGWRLAEVSGYTVAGKGRLNAIFEKAGAPEGVTHHGMTKARLSARTAEYSKLGYRLKHVTGYHHQGTDRYAAIWEKPAGGMLRARFGVGASSLQRTGDVDRLQGWSPIAFQGFSSGKGARFNFLYETPFRQHDLQGIHDTVTKFLKDAEVAGVSLAIAKDGKLKYASGFGKAHIEKGTALDAFHRLRIGSVSKTITATAIFRLIDEHRLRLDDEVFGPGGRLDVPVPPEMKAMEGATIQDFLEHTSGLPGAGHKAVVGLSTDKCGKGFDYRLGVTFNEQVAEAKKQGLSPLSGQPGQQFDYANLGFDILRRVGERALGGDRGDFEAYIRANIFKPAGILTSGPLAPALFKMGDYDPKSGESQQYGLASDGSKYAPETIGCHGEPWGPGAGGWSMSAADLLRYFAGVDGIAGRDLLSGDAFDDMVTAAAAMPTYGRGWQLGAVGDCASNVAITHGHNGGINGGWAFLYGFPDGHAIAVAGNQAPKRTGTNSNGDATFYCTAEVWGKLLKGPLQTIDWPEHDLF